MILDGLAFALVEDYIMGERPKHFYQLSYQERLAAVVKGRQLTAEQIEVIKRHATEVGDSLIENYLTNYQLPEGVLPQIRVNGQDYSVTMVTEEPSVIAAASNGARLLTGDTGITAQVTHRLVEGQVIITTTHGDQLRQLVEQQRVELLRVANASHPTMQQYGGGAKSVAVRQLDDTFWAVELQVGVGEAMGANVINTMTEAVAEYLRVAGMDVLMSILSNAGDYQLVTVSATVPVVALAKNQISGAEVARKIQSASHIAQIDPKRAVTHNKGIMNGIDAAVIAIGNDWRAVEAAAHAYASRDGRYRGLSNWEIDGEQLRGHLTVPLPIGLVGGATKVLKLAAINQRIAGFQTTQEAMQVIAAVGLAQNLAALKALVTEGIQAGHMKLQLNSMIMANGAAPEEVPAVSARLAGHPNVDAQLVVKTIRDIRQTKGE